MGHVEELIRFRWPLPNFQGYLGHKLPNLSPKVLVCTISHELVGRFQQDLHGYNIGTWWRAYLILLTMTYFSRSVRDLHVNCQIWAKRCLCAHYFMNQLADFNQICMDMTFGHDNKLNRFWWPWSNFQGYCLPKLSQKVFVCMLSHGPLDGMLPNLQAYINRTGSMAY